MAKEVYKIPASLDENYLNMEIALQSKDGVGLKPLPVRVILVWLLGLLALFYVVVNESSVIASAGMGVRVVFGITWLAFLYVLTQTDKSHRMQLELIPALLSYIQKSNRSIITRKTSNANAFYGVVGIESIDADTGLVTYTDKTFGYWYSVVGTASVLLFPEDRNAILDRVNDFYKKLQSDCELVYVTTKEPQRIHKQTAHLMAQYKALEFKDPDIDDLVREQYDVLKNFVGKEFKSLHQYMVVKGDSREALSNVNNIIIGEYQNSSLMYKQCVPMYHDEICDVLHLIYGSI
jgi:hypothetical protein